MYFSQRPANHWLSLTLVISAAVACIVTVVCVAWAAVAEVNIKRSTCWFDNGAIPNKQYTCSSENAACNFLRFTDLSSYVYDKMDTACLEFRYSRYMLIPPAMVSLVLNALYTARV